MKLELQPATKADVQATASIYGPQTGDLVAPLLLVGWPLTEPNDLDNARSRAEWSAQQQVDLMENDPSTQFVKVVDKDNNNDIVCLARWHKYTNRYPMELQNLEICGLKDRNDPATWPEGFVNKELFVSFLDEACVARNQWIPDKEYWGRYQHCRPCYGKGR